MSLSRIRFDGAFSFALLREITCSTASYGVGVLSTALRKGQEMYFNQVEFGERMQEARKLAGMTQEELADMLGIDKNHVSRLERGAKACSIDILVEISAALRVSTDYLLTGRSIDLEDTRSQVLSVISQLTKIAQNL